MAPSSNAATTSVQVALRIRPNTQQDATSIPARFQRTVIHAVSNQAVSVDSTPSTQPAGGLSSGSPGSASTTSAPAKKQTFAFDQVHGPDTSQYQLFQATAEPLISRFVEGFNCTILAYGQTSSGKTHSMTGIDLDADPSDPHNGMGIIPRAISAIFSRAAAMKEEKGGAWTYSIKGSFIELYNEDLIDLLSYDDVGGGRRDVQIREDKHGHIIWDGLREVSVRNTSEVMSLIRQGTSIRRTNETDMNAQSSRSHAIFSLTLSQKKFTGGGPPPRSTTPVPPGGRSPSRLARPVSQYSGGSNRVSSPTFGRPPTPSFAVAMGRGGSLRPSSALGSHTPDGKARNVEDESGEWVTIVSKFHFVDLAGSERLKRTAAAGERIKEGISINSGLLALGNVISALGDPARAKSHTASHVPYRDSKLTRLLQDSLGGNAHTLMIACVSPAEWNAGETINTLKYANRARNIKNRAVVTEKEEGWDDLEWLQNNVTRLRKELKSLKEGGAISMRAPGDPAEMEGASKKVLDQMVELQSNYEDLRGKFVDRTEELTRLRRELGEKQRNSSAGAISGTAKYEEIVGPVIEEYEKTISAMEAELSLNRAALRHTNDLVEEKEEELSQISERHSATELYVEELKSRVGKLAEREASTEAYIRDLEEKIKHHEDSSLTSTESFSDLKREIARFKDGEDRSAHYISELEHRLARSDESILALRSQVEKLEKDSEVKRYEMEVLQARLDTILNDGESWRSDLEERERKVRDLELKMEEWQARRREANEDRARLGDINDEVQQARRSLELDMVQVERIRGSRPESPVQGGVRDLETEINAENQTLNNQLLTLRETHAATLADLSSISAKYRDALKEISDLASQINEIKLGSPSSRSESPERTPDSPVSTSRRRLGSRARELPELQINGAGRRLFFRQAASTESLHSRSRSQSQSLSQELYSARSRMLSSPEIGGASGLGGRHSPTGPRANFSISLPIGPGHERSVASLEKEIMRLQEVLKEREAEISTLETTLKDKERAPTLGTDRDLPNGHASPSESDLSPQIMNQIAAIRRSMEIRQPPSDLPDDDEPLDRLNELMLSMAQKEAQHREDVDELNEQLTLVRRQHDDLTKLSRDQALNMSTELDALRGEHGGVLSQLEDLQQREATLIEERKALEQRHVEELNRLRFDHETVLREKQADLDVLMESLKEEHDEKSGDLHKQLADASEIFTKSQRDHEEALGKLRSDHEDELRKLSEHVKEELAQAKEEYTTAVAKIVSEHNAVMKEKEETLHRTEEEYYAALSKLRSDHAEVLAKKGAESMALIERLKEQHAGELKMAELSRAGSLTESQSRQAELLQQLQAEHVAAAEKKEAAFAEDLRKLQEEHVATLAKKQADHSASIERLKSKHSARLSELEESKNLEIAALQQTLASVHQEHETTRTILQRDGEDAMQKLRQEHADVLLEITRSQEEAINKIKADHERLQEQAAMTHRDALDALLKDKLEEIGRLKADHHQLVSELENSVVAARDQHIQDLENARLQGALFLEQERDRLGKAIADLENGFAQERETFRKDHELLLEELASYKAASEEYMILQEQTRQVHEDVLQKKDQTIARLQESVDAAQIERLRQEAQLEQLREELKNSRTEQEKLAHDLSNRDRIADDLSRHQSMLGEVQVELQKTKDHRDGLLAERSKQESIVRDLQVQLARTINVTSPDLHPPRQTPDRTTSYGRVNGSAKLPPLTPPPSVPPPPAPKSVPPVPSAVPVDVANSVSSQSNTLRSSSSSRESNNDSPSTSTAGASLAGSAIDVPLTTQVEEQARHLAEQETMIKTLNKQLSHCESDLQAHMDLVSTLETSLGDSEKNLRKARMQATELARERDTLNAQIEKLRRELDDAHREVTAVRRSIAEEKQSLESRLDEERRAKERVRQQLDMRVEELQKRKSKFVCL